MPYASLEIMEEWMKFYHQVVDLHPHFFVNLSLSHPELTDREVKYCAMFLFECTISEIAERMGNISPEAVVAAKHRLKKKLGLKIREHIAPYLLRLAAGIIVPPPDDESALAVTASGLQ
jgi:DNA-binding CsgD family transcriptional regulator